MTVGLPQADKSLSQKPDLFTLFSIVIGYRQHLRVVGDSMERTLKEGDLITYKKNKSKKFKLRNWRYCRCFSSKNKKQVNHKKNS